jgi:hypothetical protein
MDLRAGNLETIKRYLELDPALYEETVDDEVQWKGCIFSADVLKVKLPDGSFATREIAWHHGGCGVAAFHEGKALPRTSVSGCSWTHDARDTRWEARDGGGTRCLRSP